MGVMSGTGGRHHHQGYRLPTADIYLALLYALLAPTHAQCGIHHAYSRRLLETALFRKPKQLL